MFTALVGLSALTLFSCARAQIRKAEHTQVSKHRDRFISEIGFNTAECEKLKKDIWREEWRIEEKQKETESVKKDISTIGTMIVDNARLQREQAINQKQMRENIALATEERDARKHQLQALRSHKAKLQTTLAMAVEEKSKYTGKRHLLAWATVKAIEQQTR